MKQSNQDYVLTPNIPSAMFGNLIGFGIIGLIVGSALGFILESLLLGTGIFVVFIYRHNKHFWLLQFEINRVQI